MSHTEIGGNEPYRISSITLRVPAERFDETIERIRAHGREVIAEDVTGRDVTAAFTDIQSRMRNAQATEKQLLEIMATSRTVQDTLEVQREVAKVREQIETFQGQLNVLADQAALSTITVNMHPVPDLRVERRAPDQYAMHESVEFPITVINDGTVELRRSCGARSARSRRGVPIRDEARAVRRGHAQRGLDDRPDGAGPVN